MMGHASRTHDAGTERLSESLGHHGLDRLASPERDLLMVRHVKLHTRYRNMADFQGLDWPYRRESNRQ